MKQKYHVPHPTTKDAFTIHLFIMFVIFTVFFLTETGYAQLQRNPEQASGPSVYRLIGTIEGTALAGAVIGDAAGSQFFYRLYERLPDGSQVVRVQSDSISLKRSDGTSYDLYIHGSNSSAQQAMPSVSAGAVSPMVAQDGQSVDEQKDPDTLTRGNPPAGQTRGRPRQRKRNFPPEE